MTNECRNVVFLKGNKQGLMDFFSTFKNQEDVEPDNVYRMQNILPTKDCPCSRMEAWSTKEDICSEDYWSINDTYKNLSWFFKDDISNDLKTGTQFTIVTTNFPKNFFQYCSKKFNINFYIQYYPPKTKIGYSHYCEIEQDSIIFKHDNYKAIKDIITGKLRG